MNREEINRLYYIDKNYSKIKEILKNSDDSRSFNLLGKIALNEGDLSEANKYFNKASYIYGCAYCEFLSGNLTEAEILLTLTVNSSNTVDWLHCLIRLLQGQNDIYPTYFEIRNYYEQDLEMLFKYQRHEYISSIINSASIFEKFNREIYKYNARVLLNHGYIEAAKKFIQKSLDIFYKDPETHYLYGNLYELSGEKDKAISKYQDLLKIYQGYYPAEKKLKDCII